jgi:hypothetical protein
VPMAPVVTTQVATVTMSGEGVPLTPSISTQPASQTITAGQTATFSVTATGAASLSYQWKKTGTAINGATSSSYTTPSETTSDTGSQFTVVVSNSAGNATSTAATLTVNAGPGAPLQIATSLLANAQAGIKFQASLAATGGAPPYQWSIASGAFPPSISLNAASGSLSGTPSQGGQFDFSVQVSDSSSPTPQTAMKALTLSVLAFALQITPGGLPSGQVGLPFQATITGSGGVTPYTWSITGALPSGLSLNASSGGIAGTPTQAGTSAFTIVLMDSMGQTAQKSSSITIAAAGPPASGQVVITPSTPPAVNQGTTFQFTANAAGTWSCSGTDSSGATTPCKGSINASTGLYTAPATVTALHSYGGFQLLPNNHIFNTRIDSLPVNPNNSAWMTVVNVGGSPNYSFDFPLNYVTPSTPTQNMAFYYTPANNGTYEVPDFPDATLESGWFSARTNQPPDHHMEMIDTTSGQFEEFYQYYAVGLSRSCLTCNSQSGIKYAPTSYALPAASTDAAGLQLMPLQLGIQEMEQAVVTGGTINHALRNTFGLGFECSCNIWPATTFATDGGTVPFGARARLKASFDISKYSPIAKILLTQLKQYGMINADGGNNWPMSAERGRWPKAYVDALKEVAGIGPNLVNNMEFVDESALMVSPMSGLTTVNRELVTFIRASDSATTSVDVALQGVAVNLPQDVLYIQAGTPAQQFTAFVNIGSVTWSTSPSIGTLTSGGLYTAPASIGSTTTMTVTATSVVNPSVAASMTVTIFPIGVIRVLPSDNTNYVDSLGNTWTAETGVSNLEDDLGCCSADDRGTFANITDKQLWYSHFSKANDIHLDFRVPAGTYQITYRLGTWFSPGTLIVKLGAQGQILADNVDLAASAGGIHLPYSFTSTISVGSDNKLSFGVWNTGTGTNGSAGLSSFQIAPSH